MRNRSGVASAPRDELAEVSAVSARCSRAWRSMLPIPIAMLAAILLVGCAVGVGPDDPDARRGRDATSGFDEGTHVEDVRVAVDVPVAESVTDSPPISTDVGRDAPTASCGDGVCNAGETCTTCMRDCGACPARCGDGMCNGGETCSTCVVDCGACAARCGDGTCNAAETCATCVADCGACAPRCGDHVCNGGETCSTCAGDCGVCPPRCGDGTCNGGETCTSCQGDCGACPPRCGDGTCNGGETCSSCAGDCGACPPPCGEMRAGRTLARGDSITSCDGRFVLVMQGDGNLVLYQGSSALWSTSTGGTTGNTASMQSDGNFVLYNTSGGALWSSVTAGNPGAWLALQTDGNLVLYSSGGSVLWSSSTCCH